jgi:hypothetical protein
MTKTTLGRAAGEEGEKPFQPEGQPQPLYSPLPLRSEPRGPSSQSTASPGEKSSAARPWQEQVESKNPAEYPPVEPGHERVTRLRLRPTRDGEDGEPRGGSRHGKMELGAGETTSPTLIRETGPVMLEVVRRQTFGDKEPVPQALPRRIEPDAPKNPLPLVRVESDVQAMVSYPPPEKGIAHALEPIPQQLSKKGEVSASEPVPHPLTRRVEPDVPENPLPLYSVEPDVPEFVSHLPPRREEPAVREPIYPPRPTSQPQPPNWPDSPRGRWPDLPPRAPAAGNASSRASEPDRQQRLEQEQKGSSWNA